MQLGGVRHALPSGDNVVGPKPEDHLEFRRSKYQRVARVQHATHVGALQRLSIRTT